MPSAAKHQDTLTIQDNVDRSQKIILATNLIKLVLSLILTVFLGRALLPADFGFFTVVASLIVLAYTLSDLGTNDIAIREIADCPQQEKYVLESFMAIRLVIGLILGVACLLFGLLQESFGRQLVIVVLSACLPFLFVNVLQASFTVRQAQSGPAVLQIGSQSLLLIGTFIAYSFHAAGWVYALLLISRESMTLVGLRYLAIKLTGSAARPRWHKARLKNMASSIVLVGLASIFYSTYFHFGTLLVWVVRPAEEMGAYAASLRLFLPLASLPFMLAIPLLPALTRLAKSDFAQFSEQIVCFLTLTLSAGLLVAAGGYYLGADLLSTLYDNKFNTGNLSSVNSIRWLALAFGTATVTPVIVVSLLALRHERALLGISFVGMIVNILMCLVLFESRNFDAAAIAVAAGFITIFVLGVAVLFPRLKFLNYWRILPLCCIPVFIFLLVFNMIDIHSSVLRLITGGFISSVGLALIWNASALRRARLALREVQ